MYAAFWLKPEAEDANKRVVICLPFSEKPMTAWAILSSAIHEKRTGGIIAGPKDNLKACVDAIDHNDEGWPDDPDRMVASITNLAKKLDCKVIFRQNMEPDGTSEQSEVWSQLAIGGTPEIEQENGRKSVIRYPLVGHPMAIAVALELGRQRGWFDVSEDSVEKQVGSVKLSLSRYRTVESRASLTIEYPVEAITRTSKTNSAGTSREVKIGFDNLEEVIDMILGPTNKKHKFVLMIKDRSNSILFFGNKEARTVRQAIEQYMDHLYDRKSSDTPKANNPDDPQEQDITEEIVTPKASDCRFWTI